MLRRRSIIKAAVIIFTLMPLIFNQSAVRTNGQQIDNPISWSSPNRADAVQKINKEFDGSLQMMYGKKGVPTFIGGKLSTKKVLSPNDAIQVLDENSKLFKMSSASNEMLLITNESDKIGNMFKFQQVYEGVPVYGHTMIVHSNLNGETTSINGEYDPDVNSKGIDVKPSLTKEQAIQAAKSASGLEDVKKFELQTAELCIYNQNDAYHLAYAVKLSTLEGGKPAYLAVFIDAHNSEVLNKYSLMDTVSATGSGTGVLNDTKTIKTDLVSNLYYLRDVSRPMHTSLGGDVVTYSANNGTSTATLLSDTDNIWSNPAAVDAHYYAGAVFNYYWTKFQRNSFDKQGSSINSVVQYGTNYNNAFWNGTMMVYGDGDGSTFIPLSGAFDVVGHELTHAVVEHSAALEYHNQSGALNESIADVFGNLIEDKSGNLWLLGEDVYTPGVAGDALRSMANPTLYDQPDNMANYVILPDTENGDYGGVHTNSGIPNKAFFNFVTSSGITRDDAGQVWYRALTQYLTPQSQFIDARSSTIQAATDLFGASSPKVLAVTNAWNAVGVVPDQDPYEPNNTLQTAYGPMSSGVPYSGYISTTTDQDWFKFTVGVAGPTTIDLTNLPSDYDLYIYDANSTLLGSSKASGTASEELVNSNAPVGTYYIKVVSYSGVSTTQPYNLTATFTAAAQVGQLQFSAATYSVNEAGSTATITVSRVNGSSGAAGVTYATSNGTATAGSDYTAKTGTLAFAAGELSKTFTIPITNDTTVEGNETVILKLSAPTGGATLGTPIQSILTIVDNDAYGKLQFSAATYSVNEAGPTATITVSRVNGSSGAVGVTYATSNGTATAGSDYTTKTGTLAFAAGELSKTFTIPITNDTTVESNETVILKLSAPTGGATLGTPIQSTLTIVDNDTPVVQPGKLQFSAATYSVSEAGPTATITVSRVNGSSGAVGVTYATSNGTATAGSDYTTKTGTLAFAAGELSKTFTIPITNDTTVESNETVILKLSAPTGGATLGTPIQATLTIIDNDGASSTDPYEPNNTLATAYGPILSGGAYKGYISTSTDQDWFKFTTSVVGTISISLTNLPKDYDIGLFNSSKVLVGFSKKSGTGSEAIVINSAPIGTYYIEVFGWAGNYSANQPYTLTATFTGASQPGKLQFSSATYSVSEAGPTATITVSRVNGSSGAVGVTYAASNGTATAGADYTAKTGILSFAAGEVTKTFTVPIINDTIAESSETVKLTLSAPTGGVTLGTPSQATLTITNLPSGLIKGLVKDAATNTILSGVTVAVKYNSAVVRTVTTSTDGSFSLAVPSRTGYQVSIAKNGYITQTVGNVSVSGATTYLETILLVPDSVSVGGATGTIKNALTGLGVSGLTLNLRSGQNTTTGTIVKTTTTDSVGMYSVLGLNAGTYTGEIKRTGYQTAFFTIVIIGGTTKTGQDATITPVLSQGETRIVLTWGQTPSDLDSHLTGPTVTTGTRFHTYYSNKAYTDSVSSANLDLDDISSYGPETTTISLQGSGVYRFSVHNFSNRSATSGNFVLANSGAQVKVYRANSQAAIFNVPTDKEGTLWTVFELNGSTIAPINRMAYVSSASDPSNYVTGNHSDAVLLKNLPKK